MKKRKKSPSPTKKKSSHSFKKRLRPKICKVAKKKGHAMHQVWAASPKKTSCPPLMPKWMKEDDIPMEHFSGSGRPKHTQCTCKTAPTKYCWVHKGYADPSCNVDLEGGVKMGDLFNGKELPDLYA